MDLFNKKRIDALELEVTFLKQKLADKNEALHDLQNRIDTETDIAELSEKRETLLAEFEQINVDWQEKMDTLSGIDSVLLKRQEEVNELSSKFDALEQTILEKTEEHELLEANLPKMREESNWLQKEIVELKEKAELLQAEIDGKNEINNSLTSSIEDNRVIIGEMESKLNNKDVYLAEITELENSEAEIKKRINLLYEHKEALDLEIVKTSQELEKINAGYIELRNKNLKLEEEVAGVLSKFSDDISELTQRNRGLVGEYTRYTEDKINTEKELLNLKNETDAIRRLKNQYNESINSKEAELRDLKNLIDTVKKELMEYENQKEAVKILLKESEVKLIESQEERDKISNSLAKFIKGLSTEDLQF
ncbi:MAG: hypothetical protein AB9882_12735 [Ignavibacteriaceae bacterium]